MDRISASLIDAALSKLTVPNALVLSLLLLTAAVTALIMYVQSHPEARSLRGFLSYAFPREILTHPSARADFVFWWTRKLLMFIVMAPITISAVATVGYLTHASLGGILALDNYTPEPAGPAIVGVFTISMLLVYDLSYYLFHRMQHRFPILWELHKVHHSAEVLVGITKDRIHPIDEVLGRLWDGLLPGIAYGIWLFFALDPVEVVIFGINVYVMRKILILDYIRHTHLKVSFGPWLNHIIICPHYHQLHHSNNLAHYNKNFGFVMPIWDRMFGTLAIPRDGKAFCFGLTENEHKQYQSLFGLYVLPVKKAFGHVLPYVQSLNRRVRILRHGAVRGEFS